MMAPISNEVILGDLDRAKIIIKEANNTLHIIPNEIKNIISRYKIVFSKWKKTKYNIVEADAKATTIIEKEEISLGNELQPIT